MDKFDIVEDLKVFHKAQSYYDAYSDTTSLQEVTDILAKYTTPFSPQWLLDRGFEKFEGNSYLSAKYYQYNKGRHYVGFDEEGQTMWYEFDDGDLGHEEYCRSYTGAIPPTTYKAAILFELLGLEVDNG